MMCGQATFPAFCPHLLLVLNRIHTSIGQNPLNTKNSLNGGMEVKPEIVIVVVGFKVNTENSMHYEKLHDPTAMDIGHSIWKAGVKGADFCSVRIIRKGEVKP